jgi:hypothetical protein
LTNWPAIDAWRQAQAWKSHARFPQSQTNDYGDSIGDSKRYLTRSAGEQRDGKMVEPGALETCNTEKPFEAVLLARTRAQRIPSRSRAHAQIKTGYICADHTVIFTFRLRQSGGPYIPYCRSYPRNRRDRLYQQQRGSAVNGSPTIDFRSSPRFVAAWIPDVPPAKSICSRSDRKTTRYIVCARPPRS